MSYEKLTNIVGKYKLPDSKVVILDETIKCLRKSDVLTKSLLSRKLIIDVNIAEEILIELVNKKVLELLIYVECEGEEYQHGKWFYSLEEYYNSSSDELCQECDALFDFQHAKVGFRRGNL